MNKPLGWIAVLASVLTLASACTHTIESPVPKGDSAEPDLVCNDTLYDDTGAPASPGFSTVVLHGHNLTPMPIQTLDNKKPPQRELRLPQIKLDRLMDLPTAMGVDPGPASKVVTDDPKDTANSQVHWTSEELMSFDIKKPNDMTDPALTGPFVGDASFPIGVFTITMTNPDGLYADAPAPKDVVTKTVIEKGLAVLPRPIISSVMPPAICDEEADQKVVINGAYFLTFDDKVPTVLVGDPTSGGKTYTPVIDDASCTPIDGAFKETNVKVCSSMAITIKTMDFPVTMPTKLRVTVINPAPANCKSSNDIELTINPPPRVDSIVPSSVCEGGSEITIHGANFQMGAKVTVSCMGGQPVTAQNVMVMTDGMSLTAFVPSAIANATCEVVVTNPDGCEDRPLPHKTVTGTSGPILFYVDPPVVYNGINTRITLFVTSVTETPGMKPTVTMSLNGMPMPLTTLQVNYPVPNHPNRIEAIVPISTPPGTYDIHVADNSPCPATLQNALIVTDALTVTLKSVNPPFGYTNTDTAVTIFRDTMAPAPGDKPFVVTPRVFLNPTNPPDPMATATTLEDVSFVDADTATGVVPAGTPVHHYDVVLVNPDGSVGLLKDGYEEVMNPPPTVLSATPSSIPASSGQVVTLTGTSFDPMDKVTLICEDAVGNTVAPPVVTSAAPVCGPTGCTQKITIDGSTLAAGDVCVVRVQNPDGTYGEYSAIGVTTPSLNLNSPHVGTAMNTGRRALSAASGNATPAARFVYALGGDSGMASGALDSTEFAPVDLFGKMGAWTTQTFPLNAPRTLAGSVTVGRYIYLIGGDSGMGPIDTAERALILSPLETPVINDVDLKLVQMPMTGVMPGEYHYRVSAIFDPKDTDNPGGESLASDPFTIRLPSSMFAGKQIQIILSWAAPVDALKQPVPGVVGYRIYRSAKPDDPPGSEVLLKTVMGAATLTFTDDGTAVAGTEKPLPTGSTGAWAQLPNLGTKRSGLGVAAGDDPVTPGKFYVYALLGKSAAATATTTYEYLPVTVAPNGRQTVGAAWTPGAAQSAQARWQLGVWTATSITSSTITAPDTYIFLGGGEDANNALVGKVEAGKITMGGDLGPISDTPKDFSSTSAGYGVCAANNQLFVFGGQGAAPFSGAKSAQLVAPPPTLANNSWNSEGLTMTHGRYLMGSSVQSAFIFLLGGQTDEPSNASKTTELVIW